MKQCNHMKIIKKTSQDSREYDAEMIEILRKHNERFQQKSYEPRRFGLKDIRKWEESSGLCWNSLNHVEREKANREIAHMKSQQ